MNIKKIALPVIFAALQLASTPVFAKGPLILGQGDSWSCAGHNGKKILLSLSYSCNILEAELGRDCTTLARISANKEDSYGVSCQTWTAENPLKNLYTSTTGSYILRDNGDFEIDPGADAMEAVGRLVISADLVNRNLQGNLYAELTEGGPSSGPMKCVKMPEAERNLCDGR